GREAPARTGCERRSPDSVGLHRSETTGFPGRTEWPRPDRVEGWAHHRTVVGPPLIISSPRGHGVRASCYAATPRRLRSQPSRPMRPAPRMPVPSRNTPDGSGTVWATKVVASGAKSAIWASPNGSVEPSVRIEERGQRLYDHSVTGNSGPWAFGGWGG